MPKITRIWGQMYEQPSIAEGVTYPEPTFSATVGAPYNITGPIIDEIRIEDGGGTAGPFDLLVAYNGQSRVLEVPRALAFVEYEHDPNATPYEGGLPC